MALKHLVDLDLGGNEIQNVVLQNLATAPTGVAGQIYYDTAAGSVKVHTGSGFTRVGLSVDGSTITESNGTISVGTIAISKVSGLQTALNNKVDDSQVLTNVPAGAKFTDTTYSVGDGGLTEKNFTDADRTKLDGIEARATETAHPAIVNNSGVPTLATGVTGAEVRSLIGAGTSSFNGSYASLTNVPTTFAPSAHTHAISEVVNLQTELDNKVNLAVLTDYATRNYVATEISNLVAAAPGTLDTLNELAAALGDDPNFATTITTSIGTKLDKTHDMTLTLNGDASGSATFTNMGNATLTVAVANDSHTHDGRYYTKTQVDNAIAKKGNYAALSVTGHASGLTSIDLQPSGITTYANIQVIDLGIGEMVMTSIQQPGDGTAIIALNPGAQYKVLVVGL